MLHARSAETAAGGGSILIVDDRAVSVTSDDPTVEGFVRDAFAPALTSRTMLLPRMPCDRAEIRTTPPVTVTYDGANLEWPPEACGGGDPFLAAFYGTREIVRAAAARVERCFSLYGAAARVGDGAVVLLGASGFGKTGLLLALVARGAGLYGDECLFIDRATWDVRGLPRTLMIREPLVALLPSVRGLRAACAASPSYGPAPKRLWYAVRPEKIFERDVSALPAPLRAVITIDAERADFPSISPIAPTAALAEVVRRMHTRIAASDAAAILGALRRTACYRLRLGPPAASAAAIRKALA